MLLLLLFINGAGCWSSQTHKRTRLISLACQAGSEPSAHCKNKLQGFEAAGQGGSPAENPAVRPQVPATHESVQPESMTLHKDHYKDNHTNGPRSEHVQHTCFSLLIKRFQQFSPLTSL